LLINRDLSWLEFNRRVLEEAKDPSVPLLERLSFFAIFSCNLDEVFMGPGGGLKRRANNSGTTPDEGHRGVSLDSYLPKSHELAEEHISVSSDLIICHSLPPKGLHLLRPEEISREQEQFLERLLRKTLTDSDSVGHRSGSSIPLEWTSGQLELWYGTYRKFR